MLRRLLVLPVLFGLVGSTFAQTVQLGETVRHGDHFQYEMQLSFDGKQKELRDGKIQAMTRRGEATHKFTERIEAADTGGAGGKAVRYYELARSLDTTAGDPVKLELSADRRLTVAVRTETGTLHICPDGPFTREELQLVGDHFDTLAIPALLPNKELKTGETWKIADDAVQHACLFEGLVKNELQGTLGEVKDDVAAFRIVGKAEGIELGATVRLTVSMSGTFDVKRGRVTSITWEQDDDRDQGPASPAIEAKVNVRMTRTQLAEEPKELSAEARTKVPAEKIPAEMTLLRLTDTEGKYSLTYPRGWNVIGQTGGHTVLRLLEAGTFSTQATITPWRQVDAGQHTLPADFKTALTKIPKWEPTEVLADAEVTGTAGKWIYKYSAKGKQDSANVVQSFYLIAGPSGQQAVVTFLSTPEKAAKMPEREAELLQGIGFLSRR
jgi:hypothetical protein